MKMLHKNHMEYDKKLKKLCYLKEYKHKQLYFPLLVSDHYLLKDFILPY